MAWKFSPIFSYKVKGKSMEPSYKEGSRVLVNRLSYLFKKPRLGDVVVLNATGNEGLTLVAGAMLKRIVKIERDKYFVEGDNKKASTDSRAFGPVNKKQIIGKVIKRI